jgi:ABC-type multidrug transport system fused ATPase/permease subunit
MGGAALSMMTAETVRTQVALVNQEHHVFVGTMRDNLCSRPDADDDGALARSTPWTHAVGGRAPDGLDTRVGTGGQARTRAVAARPRAADLATRTRARTTSLLDPRAARHLERSLDAVLEGRTVIAIAHRLHTAYDADRIAVVDGGRITELGSHHELVAADGAYAALWHSWQDADTDDDSEPSAPTTSTTP